jgi:hypothetical protein
MAMLLGQAGLPGTLAAALGPEGRTAVNGIPVATLMRTLSSLYGQAAADADELMFLRQGEAGGLDGEDAWEADTPWSDQSVYAALIDAENDDIAEALGAW